MLSRRSTWKRAVCATALSGLLGVTLTSCSADRFVDENDEGPGPGRACETDRDCKSGRRCIERRCYPDHGDCRSDNDCQDDTACACPPELQSERCACIPWGMKPRDRSDMMCAGAGFTVDEFRNPVVKCQWPPSGMTAPAYKDVMTTPVVIDLDGDGETEIVFTAGYVGSTHLVAISGKDCSVKFDKATPGPGCSNLGAADLDGDGKAEIVAVASGLTVFDHTGAVLATRSEIAAGLLCVRDYAIAFANLDGEGFPEIIVGAAAYRYYTNPKPQLQPLWNKNLIEEGAWGTIPVVADLDGDGKPEVITGHNVFDGLTGADKTPSVMKTQGGGYAAVADWNSDGKPDIALVSSKMNDQKVSIIDYQQNRFLLPPQAAQNGWGGPPTVADFDGDGKPEIGTAGASYYYVYSPDCAMSPLPAKCQGIDDGVLWQSDTQDLSSGSTGSSVFDFNGDGVAEVVYRDECWLRVFHGRDGRKLFASPVTSGTVLDEPVIADVDGDGHAEIVVASDGAQNNACKTGRWSTELGIPHSGATYGVRPRVSAMVPRLRVLVGQLSAPDRLPQIEIAVGEGITVLVFRHLLPFTAADEALLAAFARDEDVQVWGQLNGPDSARRLFPAQAPGLVYTLPEFGVSMAFRPTDFTQVNMGINRLLMRRAMQLLDPRPGERIADLFCGLGNFSLPIAKSGARVVGVEGSDALVRRAGENARANGLEARSEFHAANLFEATEDSLAALGRLDKMLIDPPREGAIAVVKALGASAPARIVYVSCNPATLARDTAVLIHEKGYRLKGAGIANMFPQTSHVESIALFERG